MCGAGCNACQHDVVQQPCCAGHSRSLAAAEPALYLSPPCTGRSVTILPAALDPHSLASVPSTGFGSASFTFR